MPVSASSTVMNVSAPSSFAAPAESIAARCSCQSVPLMAAAGCDGVVKRSADEEYVRRWAVYDVGAPKKRRKKRSEL